MREHLKKITDFLRSHGAEEINTTRTNGGHTRIWFNWGGVPMEYVTASTPSDYRAAMNDVADLRRMLGRKPIPPEPKEKRRLDEMLSSIALPMRELPMENVTPLKAQTEAPAKLHGINSLAYVGLTSTETFSKSLRLQIPEPVYKTIGAPTHVLISRVDDNTWKIAGSTSGLVSRVGNRQGYVLFETRTPTSLYDNLGVWGTTAGECVIVDNEVLVSVDLTKLKPAKEVHARNGRTTRTGMKLVEAPDLPVAPVMPSKEDIKKALEVIQQVQSAMPHLKLVRRNDGHYEFKFDLGC